jgi:hypothetical protein
MLERDPERRCKMVAADVFNKIKKAIDGAPRNGYVAELHLQVIKYAELLENVSGREFCAQLNLGAAWGTEFAKMKKISARLRNAGLEPEKI